MTIAERTILVTAWLATSLVGAGLISSYWLTKGNIEMAIAASIFFVLILTGIYYTGAIVYMRQPRRNVRSFRLYEGLPAPDLDEVPCSAAATEEPHDDRRVSRIAVVGSAALTLAWLAATLLGAVFICRYGIRNGHPDAATILAAILVAFMAVLYLVAAMNRAGRSRSDLESFDRYANAFKPTLLQQLIFVTLGGLTLDLGQAFHTVSVATLGYWSMVLIIVLRRPRNPTAFDLHAIRYGFLFVLAVVSAAGGAFWKWMGRL